MDYYESVKRFWMLLEDDTLSESYEPKKPSGTIKTRKIIKGKGTNTAKGVIQKSFQTSSGNDVKIHFEVEGSGEYTTVFYVNDSMKDDASKVSQDLEILSGVMWIVKRFLESGKVKELIFRSYKGERDNNKYGQPNRRDRVYQKFLDRYFSDYNVSKEFGAFVIKPKQYEAGSSSPS